MPEMRTNRPTAWNAWNLYRNSGSRTHFRKARSSDEILRSNLVRSLTRSSAIAVIADRTACSILTRFIVTATSRPLNKKSVCCQSANPINNYCGSASTNPQSAHLCSAPAVGTGLGRRSHRTAPCHC